MIEIIIRNPGSDVELDKAIKKLKKIIKDEGIVEELKNRRYYIKPSERRRLEQKQRERQKKNR